MKWKSSATGQHQVFEMTMRFTRRRLLSCEVEPDGAAPVRQEQGHVAKVEVIEKGGKPVRVAFGAVVFTPFASRREAESDMVGGDTPKLGAKPLDEMSELERPGGISVHEDDGLAVALVDEVHPVTRRGSEEPALERVQVVRHPVRSVGRCNPVHRDLSGSGRDEPAPHLREDAGLVVRGTGPVVFRSRGRDARGFRLPLYPSASSRLPQKKT